MKTGRMPRSVITVLFIAGITLSATGILPAMMDALGLASLKASNDQYLRSALEKTLKTFTVLSAVKVALAVVQGSDVGIGFNLEIGDVVQSTYDTVDIAWRTVLACAAVLIGGRYLLAAAGLAGPWFLAALFAFLTIGAWLRWYRPAWAALRHVCRDLALFASVGAATLYLVLPLSVAVCRLLSSKITEPSVREAQEGFLQLRQDLAGASSATGSGLLSKLTEARDRIARTASLVKDKAGRASEWMLKLVAGYVFDCLVFPALLFLFLYGFMRKGGRYLIDLRRSRAWAGDMEAVLAKWARSGSSS